MKLYILECKSKSAFPIFGWLIRIFQGFIDFSHYALLIQTDHGLFYTYDASSRTLHRESSTNFLEKYDIVNAYDMNKKINQKAFFKWVRPLEGTVYGSSQIIGLFLMILNIYKKNPFPNGIHKLICNEFVLRVCNDFVKKVDNSIEDYDLVKTHNYLKSNFREVDVYKILSSYNIRS